MRLYRLTDLLLKERRAHKQRKLVDLDSKSLGCRKVAKLVDEDQEAEQ